MLNKRKSLIVIFALVFLLIQMSFPFVRKTGALTAAMVKITPDVIGQEAEYNITFAINQSLSVGDDIFIVFPYDTLIPCSSCRPTIAAVYFTVNGVTPNQDVIGNTGARQISIKSPVSVSAGGTVSIVVKKGARISNPSNPGDYQLQVSTTSEPSYVLSQLYHIDYSKISTPTIELGSYTINEQTDCEISFSTGILGYLEKGIDSIYVHFPKEFVLPQTLQSSKILLNGNSGSINVKTSGDNVELVVLKDIKAGSSVTIKFLNEFGLKNPAKPGQYQISIWTSKEPINVSGLVNVTDLPGVHTLMISDPLEPNGSNGWFLTQPRIILTGVSNSPGSVQTFYSIDDMENFIPYSEIIVIPNGLHTLYYFSVNQTFNIKEEVKKEDFKVNGQVPFVEANIKDNDIVNKEIFDLIGKVQDYSPISSLLLNGEKLSVDSDGSFEKIILLSQGNNALEFVIEDESGRNERITINFFVDSIPPKLSVTSPSNWEIVKSTELEVKGQTDPDAVLTINDQQASVNPDGSFSFIVNLTQKGLVIIKVVSSDNAGNKTTISIPVQFTPVQAINLVLSVGSNEVLVNGKKQTLDSPPFVDTTTGRTLVPLRFIAEAFGATVDWNGSLNTVTISLEEKKIALQVGNNTAFVNGNPVSIDQPPVIVNGRTMVPVRFISESLGATVEWNSESKMITITYTP